MNYIAEGIIRLRLGGYSPATTMSELEAAIKKSLKGSAGRGFFMPAGVASAER
jgi:hypothetical protein